MARKTRSSVTLGTTFALAAALSATGCFERNQTAFFERADVSLDVPHALGSRAGGDGVTGDVYKLVRHTAHDVNGFVTILVEGMSKIVMHLDQHRPTSHEGEWRIYGPFDDDNGRDLAWAVKISGDELGSAFEVLAAAAGTKDLDKFQTLLDGELNIDGHMRNGGMNIYFDTMEALSQLKEGDDVTKTFGGTIALSFDRHVKTEAKTIELDFQDFQVLSEGFLDDDSFYSDDAYLFRRNEDTSGNFHLALWGEFDDNGWSGPETERMQLDAVWDAAHDGRARGRIEEVDGSGDLKHGDLEISECFGEEGQLVWRTISEAYESEVPGYGFGDEEDCVYTDADL